MLSRSSRIILVDDNLADLRLTALILQEQYPDWEVIAFESGKEVLEYIRRASRKLQKGQSLTDLMLLDLNMPSIDGFKVLNILREEGLKNFPVMIYSTSDLRDDRAKAAQLQADGYYQKPFGYDETKALFAAIMGQTANA